MTTPLSAHQSNDFVKVLAVGNSKSGKTGSLASLVRVGYKLRIIDTDNLLDPLKYIVQRECPQNIDNVVFKTVRDKYIVNSQGPAISGKPQAWIKASKLCERWKDGDVDLGSPTEWGPDCVLIIDSLSRLCDAALDYHESIIPRGKTTGEYDMRAVYGNAQDAVEKLLAFLTSPAMKTNLIVIAHVTYQDQPDKTIKGFPQGVGQKLSPKIPQYFPSVILYTNRGGERHIQTSGSPLIDLSNTQPFAMQPTYPISTGLADFFAVLRPPPDIAGRKPEMDALLDMTLKQPKPRSLTLRKV